MFGLKLLSRFKRRPIISINHGFIFETNFIDVCMDIKSTTIVLPNSFLGQRKTYSTTDGRGESKGAKWDACDRVTKLGAVINIALAAGKGVAGSVSGSPALVADGVHSLSDLVSDGVTLWTTQLARQPRDAGHPYGHGRIETLGALGVGSVVAGTGLGMGWHSLEALRVLVEGTTLAGSGGSEGTLLWVALGAAATSLAVKEALFHATRAAAIRANSKVVLANAWHHRSDALSSFIAVLGVGGSMAGVPMLDPVAGVVVSLLIVRTGIDIAHDSLHELVDGGLDGGSLKDIRATALQVEGVVECQSLRGRRMGPYTSVELRVEVDPWASVSVAHHLRCRVAQAVKQAHEEVVDVVVAVVPFGAALEQEDPPTCSSAQVGRTARQMVRDQFPEVAEVSHLTCHVLPHQNDKFVILVDIVLHKDNLPDAVNIAQRLQQSLQAIDTISEADIHLDLTTIPSEMKSVQIIPTNT